MEAIKNESVKKFVRRFQHRAEAKAYAEKNNGVVERCPAVGANIDGYFKFQVVIERKA